MAIWSGSKDASFVSSLYNSGSGRSLDIYDRMMTARSFSGVAEAYTLTGVVDANVTAFTGFTEQLGT
ncbi:MAG: hypothetical protein H6767_00470 [Candidatus Peribacteria bacterium]|nr:MAG: hypothetical protein H6767_00470 [Candidatus Peribacteria bacterium]